jgi:hypothetical protein
MFRCARGGIAFFSRIILDFTVYVEFRGCWKCCGYDKRIRTIDRVLEYIMREGKESKRATLGTCT